MGKRTLARSRVKMIRVAIYLRVSTTRQLEGYGLKVQEDQCRAWIALALRNVKHTIVDVYVDGGVSGKLASREDLDRLTGDAMAGRLDLIVFGKLDRIGRTMMSIHRWMYDMREQGVRVATADNRIDSDKPSFGIELALLAYMAEMEHALILERTMGGRMQKVATGGWPLGEPPFGIMLDANGDPVLNPAEVKQVEAFADFVLGAPEPVTREDAARHLNGLDYLTRRGKKWEGGNLARRIEAGLKGYVDFAFAGENEDGEVITTSCRVEIPKTLPEERAQAVLAWLTCGSHSKGKHSSYLLSNRLFSVCGAHRTGASVTEGRAINTAGRYYRCSAGRQGSPVPDAHKDCWEIPCDEVDAAVWEEVKMLMSDKGKLQQLFEKSLGAVPERAESYRRRLAALDEQIEKKRSSCKRKIALLLASIDDEADENDAKLVEEMKAELKQQEADLIAERERVAEWLLDTEGQEARTRSLMAKINNAGTRLDDFTFEQKDDLLNLLHVRVQIAGKGVPRHRGLVDPITEWHRETGITIPVEVTDEMWATARGILSGNRQWADPRDGFEVMLEKLREGRTWKEYSGTDRIGGRSYGALYRRVTHWFESGEYERALKALMPYAGVSVPPAYVLPPMVVTGAVDPK